MVRSRRRLSQKGVSHQPSVLGAGAFKHALIEVKFPERLPSEFGRFQGLDCRAQGLRALRSLKACQSEMRLEGTFFRRNAKLLELHLYGSDYRGELRARFYARPKNARAPRAGEKSQAGEAHFDWGEARNIPERLAYTFDLFGRNLTDKFERDMHAFQANPARPGTGLLQPVAQRGKRRTHPIRNIQGHEETHAISAP